MKIYSFLLLISSVCFAHAQSKTCVIDTAAFEHSHSRIERFIPQPILVHTITLQSDIPDCHDCFALTSLHDGSTISCDDLKRAVFYLIQKNRFDTVTFDLDENNGIASLHINLKSKWVFDRVKIKGVWIGKEYYTRQYLLQPGDLFDLNKHEYSLAQIQKNCADDGFLNACVQGKLNYNSNNKTVDAIITITKGDPYCVVQIAVDCNKPEIRARIYSHFLHLLDKQYCQNQLAESIRLAKKDLMHAGYYLHDFVIKKQINPKQRTIDLLFVATVSDKRQFIFRGNRFFSQHQLYDCLMRFGQATWTLPVAFLQEELVQEYYKNYFLDTSIGVQEQQGRCTFSITEGKRASPTSERTQYNRSLLKLCSFPPFASIEAPVGAEWRGLHSLRSIDPNGFKKKSTVPPSISYIKKEMPHYYFGKTIIQNGTSLPSEIVLRELLYKPGDTWSQDAISQSLVRLKELDLFDQISLTPLSTPGCAQEKTMILKVHADDPYEMRLRLGVGLQKMSKDFTFKGISYVAGGLFLIKNPFNKADQFRIEADYTHGEQTLSVQYRRPWLFNVPLKSIFEVYSTKYLQPILRYNRPNIYNFVQQGFLFGLNYKQYTIDAQCNLGLEWMQTTIAGHHDPLLIAQLTRALNFEPLLVDKKIPYFLIEPSLVIDRLDNKLNPTHGTLTMISLKGMFPVRYLSLNSYFAKIYVDQSVFIPIKNMVLALRARAGNIFYHQFKNVMPAERFYLGGANSIRSYESDLCPPLGTLVSLDGKVIFVPQGARSLCNLNAELRIPFYNNNFFLALFQDLGALSNNHFADIKAHNVLAGTGLGIHYNTPIGPLRFDIAFKWHRPDPAISSYCWFLSFGNAF